MSPKILILGTSNSVLKSGWVGGLREALPEAAIDNRSIGGAPSYQFGWILGTDFSQFDVVFFDSLPNDEKALEEQPARYLDRLAYEVIATIAARTRVIVLGIPMDRHFLAASEIYEQRRHIAELCGAQFVGFRELMRRYANAIVDPAEPVFETQSHPDGRIASLFGNRLGRELPALLAEWTALKSGVPDFSASFTHLDPTETPLQGRVVERSNSLLSARLLELSPGEAVVLSQPRPCIGFFINTDGTRAAVELNSPAGRITVEHWHDLVDGKIELRFMPLPQPLLLSRLQVTAAQRGGKTRKPKYGDLSYDGAPPRLQLGKLVFWSGDPEATVPDIAAAHDSLILHRRIEAALAAELPAAEPCDERAVSGDQFLRVRRFDFAAIAYERQAAGAPGDPAQLNRAAQAWQQHGEFGKAADCLARSVAIAADPATLQQLDHLLVRLGRKPEAIAAFSSAMLVGARPEIALELGRLELEAGDHDAARTHLELASSGAAPEAHLLLGRTLAALKQNEAAADAFNRFLTLRPRHAQALYQLGKALLAQRRYPEAIGSLMAATEVVPANVAFIRELARAHSGLGDHLQAVLLLQPLIDGETTDWSCLITYGRAATALKRGEVAARALRRAAELRPDDAATVTALEKALALAS